MAEKQNVILVHGFKSEGAAKDLGEYGADKPRRVEVPVRAYFLDMPYVKNNRGHVWETVHGDIHIFAFHPCDPHNGPRCIKCGYGFCHHCQDGPDNDCPNAGNHGPA